MIETCRLPEKKYLVKQQSSDQWNNVEKSKGQTFDWVP